MDNDGDEDILFSGAGLFLLQNDGYGNFTEEEMVMEEPNIFSEIYFSDLDKGGDLDALLEGSAKFTKFLNWHENFVNEPKVIGSIYYDKNENCSKEGEENTLPDIIVDLNNGENYTSSNTNGVYKFYNIPYSN